jgi:hypothetical protein
MNYILYHPIGGLSGKRLAAFMGIKARRTMDAITERPQGLIRWGSGKAVPFIASQGTLNWASSLRAYQNRLEQLMMLYAGGVQVPEFHSKLPEAPLLGPCIARDFGPPKTQTGGHAITYYPLQVKVGGKHDMYMEFIPKARQFRVHVIRGQMRVRELIPDNPNSYELPIWNLDNGFTYRIPQDDVPPTVIPIAVQAISALNLDFGAVDIVTISNHAWVLEVNTAPGLCDSTLAWYARRFAEWLGIDKNSIPGLEAVS